MRTRTPSVLLFVASACIWGALPAHSAFPDSSDPYTTGSLATHTSDAGPLENRLVIDRTTGGSSVRIFFFDSRWFNRESDSVRTVVGLTSPLLVIGPVKLEGTFAEWWNPSSASTTESRVITRLVLDTAIPPSTRVGVSIAPLPAILISAVRHGTTTAADVAVMAPPLSDVHYAEIVGGVTFGEPAARNEWFPSIAENAITRALMDPVARAAGRFRFPIGESIVIDGSVLGSFGRSIAPGGRFRLTVLFDPPHRPQLSTGTLLHTTLAASTILCTPLFRSGAGSIVANGLTHSLRAEWTIAETFAATVSLQLRSLWDTGAYLSHAPFSLLFLQLPSLSVEAGLRAERLANLSWDVDVEMTDINDPNPTLGTDTSFNLMFGAISVKPHVRLTAWPETDRSLHTAILLGAGDGDLPVSFEVQPGIDVLPDDLSVGGKLTVTFGLPQSEDFTMDGDGSVTFAVTWSLEQSWELDLTAGWRLRW